LALAHLKYFNANNCYKSPIMPLSITHNSRFVFKSSRRVTCSTRYGWRPRHQSYIPGTITSPCARESSTSARVRNEHRRKTATASSSRSPAAERIHGLFLHRYASLDQDEMKVDRLFDLAEWMVFPHPCVQNDVITEEAFLGILGSSHHEQ